MLLIIILIITYRIKEYNYKKYCYYSRFSISIITIFSQKNSLKKIFKI